MESKTFKQIKGRKKKKVNGLFVLFFFSSLISFSLTGCGGGGSSGSSGGNIGANQVPVADFNVTPNFGVAPLTVNFDASGSYDPDGMITLYEWDFENDGTFDAAGPNLDIIEHTYDTPGQKTALLKVTDDKEGVDEIINDIVVLPSWELTNGPYSGSILSLTVDPTDSGVVYSITRKNQVYKSADGGISWNFFPTIDSETQENIRVQELEIDPTDNQELFLGTGSQGMYKSTDGGETWVHISNGLPIGQYGYPSIDDIYLDPTDSSVVYLRVDMGYELYKTTNGGQGWSKISLDSWVDDLTPVQDLLIDPQNTQTLYVGLWHYVSSEPHPEKGGIWKSADGGLNWLQKSGNCPWCLPRDLYGNWVRVNELAMGSQGSPRLYAGTDYCLCGSDDGGENWGMIEIVGIPVQDHQEISALEIDPNDEKTIYVGVEDQENWDLSGLWVTTNGGSGWTQYFPNASARTIKITPIDSTVFVFADGWYKRSVPTEDWQQVQFDGIVDIRVAVLSNVLPNDRGFVYAGTELGVYLTTDGGENWNSQGLEGQYIYTLVMDLNNTQKVFVGTIDGVYKTVDGGEPWEPKNSGLTAWGAFTLAMDPTNSDILYVGTSDGIFRTDDGGENWVEKGNFPYSYNSVWRLAIAPDDHLVLYASVEDLFGTEAKIYRSTNGGKRGKTYRVIYQRIWKYGG